MFGGHSGKLLHCLLRPNAQYPINNNNNNNNSIYLNMIKNSVKQLPIPTPKATFTE